MEGVHDGPLPAEDIELVTIFVLVGPRQGLSKVLARAFVQAVGEVDMTLQIAAGTARSRWSSSYLYGDTTAMAPQLQIKTTIGSPVVPAN